MPYMLGRLAIVFIVSAGCGHPPLRPGPRAPDPTGCYVIVYEHANFQGAGDMLNGPAHWPSLERLLSTNEANWRKRIRSLRVGRIATVIAYPAQSFRGVSQRFGPETSHPQLDEALSGRIESLDVTCPP